LGEDDGRAYPLTFNRGGSKRRYARTENKNFNDKQASFRELFKNNSVLANFPGGCFFIFKEMRHERKTEA
jgi:hypothetical protein